MKFPTLLLATLVLATLTLTGCHRDEPKPDRPPAPLPDFAAAVFSEPTTVTNPYYGPGANQTYVYEAGEVGLEAEEEIRIQRKVETKQVMGITCIIHHDLVFLEGVLIEDTDDWLAQDDEGNLWYLGEFVENFEDDGTFADNDGSWEAGVDGALPGFWIPANPQIGDRYMQEYWPGVAEDFAGIEGFSDVQIDLGSYANCLVTRDIDPFEPGVFELKYYAQGVGLIKEEKYQQGQLTEEVVLIEIIE